MMTGSLIGIAIAVLVIVGMWKIYTKAKKPGWAFIIPIYNILIMLEIVGKPWWWIFLMMFLPFIFGIWVINLLSLSFGKSTGWTIGMLFLPFIFIPLLGLGDAKYKGAAGK